MIVTFFRSSSYGRWDWCNHAYMIEYVLGLKSPSNKKADKGSICHKALELLARRKLAEQNGLATFKEDEVGGEFQVAEMVPDYAIELAFTHYTKVKPTIHEWTQRDFSDCKKFMYAALEFNNGMFSPLKRNIVSPEQFFDLTIEKPWAEYNYTLPDGTKLQGYMGIKGTVDLVTQAENGVIEYIDWKTGRRLDWATGQEKDYAHLRDDPQLRLYHYALCQLYPNIDEIIMTIFFIQDGGPFSLCFSREDLPKTEAMLQKRFEVIRNTVRPKLNKTWKCTKLCHFGKTKAVDEQGRETGKTLCEHYKSEVVSLGLDRVMAKYGQKGAHNSYGDGGGTTR